MAEETYPYFGSFGAQRIVPTEWPARDERLRRNRQRLARALNLHTTVAFMGAGCSRPLGYPTWAAFASLAVDCTSKWIEERPHPEKELDLERLNRFKERLLVKRDPLGTGKERDTVKPDQLSFILGTCRRILFKRGKSGRDAYFDFLRGEFKPKDVEPSVPNPYDYLLDLPIKRFITSNYDGEIEKAIGRKRHARAHDDFSPEAEQAKSEAGQRRFTQKHDYYEQLALFAMARIEDAENMVFHCHGHYSDPESMVVTESDYQEWYLRKGPEGETFRQTLDLLFSSNPILFVGYGLGDDDLLRPLRMLAADNISRGSNRPLFALLPEEKKSEDEDYHQSLYERYGLQIIPFESPDPRLRGVELCEALKRLKQDWADWWDEWLQKPFIRRVKLVPEKPKPYQHYPMVEGGRPLLGMDRFEHLLAKFREWINEDADPKKITHIIALIGPGGTGKSWSAQRLTKQIQDERNGKFQGFFFGVPTTLMTH